MSVRRVQLQDALLVEHPLHIDVADATPAVELEAELERVGFGAKPLTVGSRRFGDAATVGDLELEHGVTIGCGHAVDEPHLEHPGPRLVVVAGPDAGIVVALPLNRPVTVGRTTASDITLNDQLLSSQHVSIEIGEHGRVVVHDLGSTNGTIIEGVDADSVDHVVEGDYIHIGASILTIEIPLPDDFAVLGPPVEGERTFPRQFRSANAELPKKVGEPQPPREDDGSSGSMWWRSLLPVITGTGFAVMTGRYIFLLIIVVSPILMTYEALKRRRRTRGKAAKDLARYEAQLADFRAAVARLRRTEVRRRRHSALCGGLSTMLSATRHRRLWERLPADHDFLTVSVGLASLESAIEATDPDDAFDEFVWGTPLQHDLLETGSLAIVGPRERAQAVTRNLLVNLAATHSPVDVQFWIFTDEDAAPGWEYTRWMPHAVVGDDRSTIAVTQHDRQSAVRSLHNVLEQRQEAKQSRGTQLPVHIIVIDGTHNVPASDLAELVSDGNAVGMTAITIDERLVPEGAGATLKLGVNADEASFESREQPFVDSIFVAEIAETTAVEAMRPMAALRPTTSADAVGLGGTVHLVDLDRAATLSGPDLAEHWKLRSPHSDIVIGVTADGPMAVDIVNDGPHGLVGGTSGSGKTELLKTLFISLCLHNHPDDLSIVVVDFKGGVDHEAIRPLPHVIDVATNLDIDQFKRTIQLLKAEGMRRQDMLSAVGASNVVAYRAARERDRSLPPMPRLLVVVDEFGELLSNPEGKDQLKELESITRIGRALGLHLLLVTQNFESSLPPQIDANAGLRISLRVQKPSHSKVVLDSEAAASIPDSRIGRGYSRFHGRELVEFQTARVAGRRRDIEVVQHDISIAPMPLDRLGSGRRQALIEDVPASETDMFAIIERITEATELSNWPGSAVPWPSPLPELVSAAALAGRQTGSEVAIGLEDHPELQRRGITALSDRDDQIAFIGGPDVDLPSILSTYATSLASANSADDVHLYVIDLLGRGMAALESLPHTGAVAVRNDALATRILKWLVAEASERRALLSATSAANMAEYVALGGSAPPHLVLFINGADRMLGSESAHQQLVPSVLRLLGDAVGVRIQVVLGGLPRLVSHKLGTNITRRIVLQLSDRGDYLGAGVPREYSTDLRVARRAYDVTSGRLTQLAQLGGPGRIDGDIINELGASLAPARTRRPRRFVDITWPLPLAAAGLEFQSPPPGYDVPIPAGVALDTGDWVWLDGDDDGPLIVAAGGPKSGRTSTLAFLGQQLHRAGWSVINLGVSRRSPLGAVQGWARQCTIDDLAATLATATCRPVVLIDDINRVDDADLFKPLLESDRKPLIIAAGPPDVFTPRLGLMRGLPSVGAAFILAPRGGLDGNNFGLRRLSEEWTSNPKAGRGLLAVAGEATQVQVPLTDCSG